MSSFQRTLILIHLCITVASLFAAQSHRIASDRVRLRHVAFALQFTPHRSCALITLNGIDICTPLPTFTLTH